MDKLIKNIDKYIEELQKISNEKTVEEFIKKIMVPDINESFSIANRIVCVAPHPDDCEFSAGGTIATLTRLGKEIFIIVATDGSSSLALPNLSSQELAEIRRFEQEEAAKILGVKKVFWLNYRDGYMPYDKETRAKLITLIRALKPDMILAPDPWMAYEAHPDHRNTGLVVAEASLFSKNPRYAGEMTLAGLEPWNVKYIAFYDTSKPNFYYDITNVMDVKLSAIKVHKSQVESNWDIVEARIKLRASLYGKKAGVIYAEAFKVLPTSFLHAEPLAEAI